MTNQKLRIIANEYTRLFKNRLALITFVEGIITGLCSSLGKIGSTKEAVEISGVTLEITKDNPILSSISTALTFVVGAFFTLGIINVCKAVHNNQEPTVKLLFSGFQKDNLCILLVTLLKDIFIGLWSLLFIIPGIVKAYAYSMSEYIYSENPNKDPGECITESKNMMNGHKWDLFCLEFSYIGWYLLSILTLGILFFWVIPKVNVAKYEFYLSLKGEPKTEDVFDSKTTLDF